MQKLAIFLSILLLAASTSLATETENLGIQVLPAPGKVVIDGKFDDWDLSGGIFACGDVETQRETYSAWFHAMYDHDYLYILVRWNDATPLNNPGSTLGDLGWNGDALQVRVIIHPDTPDAVSNNLTCWKGRDGGDVVQVDSRLTGHGPAGLDMKPQGAKQAFSIYKDGSGYVQEIAVPWTVLSADGWTPKAGDKIVLTIEPNFTIGTNGRLSIKDIFRPGKTIDRVFTFQNRAIWGVASIEPQGNVPLRSVRLSDSREFPVRMQEGLPVVDWKGLTKSEEAPGVKPIEFKMPADGYISLNIRDASGFPVRHLLNQAFYAKGAHTVKWDGQKDGWFHAPGELAPAGKYDWTAIFNPSLHMQLNGWACNEGSAPWDGGPSTNWGGDMGPPDTVATDGTGMYLGWSASEAGKAVVATDLDGNVRWRHKRGGFGGAKFVAAENGAVYVVDNGDVIYVVNASDGAFRQWANSGVGEVSVADLWGDRTDMPGTLDGFDVHNGVAYLASSKPASKRGVAKAVRTDFIASIDLKTGKLIKVFDVTAPTRLKVISDTSVLFISGGNEICALDPSTGHVKTLINGLANATGIAAGADGTLFVGIRDPKNQVMVFGAEGKLLRTIGRDGGRALLGPWQSDGMAFIAGMAIDPKGRLWVSEEDATPRRFSVWDTTTGKFVREFFGPTHYGASGGAIFPQDPNVMVGEACEWRIDPKTGHAHCTGVIDRKSGGMFGGHSFARFARGSNGHDYLMTLSAWSGGQVVQFFQRLGEGNYALRASASTDVKANTTTFWSDENGDGQVQPNEVAVYPQKMTFGGYYSWSLFANTDMTLYPGVGTGSAQLKVTGFTACNAPKYDLSKIRLLPFDGGMPSPDNKMVLTIRPASGGASWGYRVETYDVETGKLLWHYPAEFFGVHGSHDAPPPQVGMIRGAFGPIGSAYVPGAAGNIWVINSNVGEWYVLTEGGYFLSKLFQGDPMKVQLPDPAIPGTPIDNVPSGMGGEDFGGSFCQAADGKLYLQAGKTGLWNITVSGVDVVSNLPGGTIDFTDADTRIAVQIREQSLQATSLGKQIVVHQLTPKMTGNLDGDFKGAQIITYQKSDDATARSAIAWDEQNLYLAWDVRDNTPWTNAATSPEQMYVSGDTVDFQLGEDPAAPKDRAQAALGDLRLSIGNFQHNAVAVLYRKVSKDKKPVHFRSGTVSDYEMQFVAALPNAKIHVRVIPGKGYVVEAAIPLEDLALSPTVELKLRGDFGVTYGDPAGQRTRLRNYWSNQHTGIVDDAVFELALEPRYWGDVVFAK